MELEYKDSGIKLWTNEAQRVENIREYQEQQAVRELERKAIAESEIESLRMDLRLRRAKIERSRALRGA